jgi:hypothetical protein
MLVLSHLDVQGAAVGLFLLNCLSGAVPGWAERTGMRGARFWELWEHRAHASDCAVHACGIVCRGACAHSGCSRGVGM